MDEYNNSTLGYITSVALLSCQEALKPSANTIGLRTTGENDQLWQFVMQNLTSRDRIEWTANWSSHGRLTWPAWRRRGRGLVNKQLVVMLASRATVCRCHRLNDWEWIITAVNDFRPATVLSHSVAVGIATVTCHIVQRAGCVHI